MAKPAKKSVQKVEVVKPIPQSSDSKESAKREEEWRIEDDVRTLQRAAEIRKDKARLNKARAWAKKRAEEIGAIASITAD
jgi:lipopolysaccharide export system protein LptA